MPTQLPDVFLEGLPPHTQVDTRWEVATYGVYLHGRGIAKAPGKLIGVITHVREPEDWVATRLMEQSFDSKANAILWLYEHRSTDQA